MYVFFNDNSRLQLLHTSWHFGWKLTLNRVNKFLTSEISDIIILFGGRKYVSEILYFFCSKVWCQSRKHRNFLKTRSLKSKIQDQTRLKSFISNLCSFMSHNLYVCTHLPRNIGLPAPPSLREMLQNGPCLILLDALRHHINDVVHHGRAQLQVEVGLHALLRHRLCDAWIEENRYFLYFFLVISWIDCTTV